MIVVLPVCQKDIEAAQRNLRWCIELDQHSELTCIVTHDTSLDAKPVLELASSYFSCVKEHTYRPPPSGDWPIPQNVAFQQSASRIFAGDRKSWFWWEQDAVPLKPKWLNSLKVEFESCRKRFMGALSSTEHGNHLNGVAIYPWNLPIQFPDMMLCRGGAFDVVGGKQLLTQAHVTELIQHVWSWGERKNDSPAPTFKSKEDLGKISSRAVIFHRCKDSTLIDLLRGKIEQPVTIQSRDEKSVGLLQLLSMRKYGTGRFKSTNEPLSLFSIFHRPKLWHCVERHKARNQETLTRIGRAVDSWIKLYEAKKIFPAHLWEPKRNAQQLGDKRDLPYLKDVLLAGMNRADKHDIIVLTNDDTILHSDSPRAITELIKGHQAIASFRLNFKQGSVPPLDTSIFKLVELGAQDLGRDLFAFRKSWLAKNWNVIPDFLLGELEWDLVMSVMVRASAGIQTTRESLKNREPSCELPYGYVLHETHQAAWKDNENQVSPAKKHNLALMRAWYADNNMPSLITLF